MQAARAEDHGRETELLRQSLDDPAAEERLGPRVHFRGDVFRDLEKLRVAMYRELRRLRWLSSDIVPSWPSASSPSNIQPSAPESNA